MKALEKGQSCRCPKSVMLYIYEQKTFFLNDEVIIILSQQMVDYPYETSRSVYSLLQICWHICSRSADDLQMIYRLSADHLQNVCRMSVEYLQNICRASAGMICKTSASLQTLCRRNSAYHGKQKDHKMHQSNNVYLKAR